MIRPIQVDHTKFLQVAIKTHSFENERSKLKLVGDPIVHNNS